MNTNAARLSIATFAIVAFLSAGAFALDNGLARTPPMGWNSWNWFHCGDWGHGAISAQLIKEIGDAMVSSGMKDAGYQYVNIDDCWAESNRDGNGGLVASRTNFPNGMREVSDYLHERGLKLGIYSDIATRTCAGTMPGMGGYHETQDCDTFVAWGVDYVKVDWCGAPSGANAHDAYVIVRDALQGAVGRMESSVENAHELVFSICNWGVQSPWTWGAEVGNLWRTTGDISINWGSTMSLLDANAGLHPYSGLGAWNDADMLEVGNGFSINQDRAHFSLWCMIASPLIAGNDIRNMSDATKEILTNTEVIAVNQDTLGGTTELGVIQAQRVINGNLEVWVKRLRDADSPDYAVLFFNRNDPSTSMSITTELIASVGGDIAAGVEYTVRDLWNHTDLDNWVAGDRLYTPGEVATQDVCMLRINAIPPIKVRRQQLAGSKAQGVQLLHEGGRIVMRNTSASPVSMSIVTVDGKVVFSSTASGPCERAVDARKLGTGVYLFKTTVGNSNYSQQFLVK